LLEILLRFRVIPFSNLDPLIGYPDGDFYVWIRKTNEMSLFVFFISFLIVAQHVSGNHVAIIRS